MQEFTNILRATDTLAAAIQDDERFSRLKQLELVHASRNMAQFRGSYDGTPVIAKLFLGPKAEERAIALTNRLRALSDWSAAGEKFRIAPLIQAMPDKSVILTKALSGSTLAAEIAATDRVATRRLPIREAGDWLSHFTSATRSTNGLAARFWLRRCRQRLDRVNSIGNHALMQALLQKQHHLTVAVQGAEVTRACSHGDFTPAKLLRHEGALYGIDIVNTDAIPLAKDLARFLVALAVEMPGTGRSYIHGIQKTDYEALVGVKGFIPVAEQELIMPFFIGIELIDRFLHITESGPCMQNLEAAIARFCEAGLSPSVTGGC